MEGERLAADAGAANFLGSFEQNGRRDGALGQPLKGKGLYILPQARREKQADKVGTVGKRVSLGKDDLIGAFEAALPDKEQVGLGFAPDVRPGYDSVDPVKEPRIVDRIAFVDHNDLDLLRHREKPIERLLIAGDHHPN